MIKSYECKDCGYRTGIDAAYDEEVEKAPCPGCDSCALISISSSSQISSDKTCSDLFWRIRRYDGA